MSSKALSTPSPSMPSTRRVHLKAEVLKAHRHRLGLTQEAFALACLERQLCVSIASVKRAETGKPLLLRTARHLAAFHGVDLGSLLASAAPQPCDDDGAAPGSSSALDEAGLALQRSEGRMVHVLCIWPVPERERADVQAALAAEAATLMPPPLADAVLAVFGLPRARRDDLMRCRHAALACAHRHVLMASGMWLGEVLKWPQDVLHDWLSLQPSGVYAHRSLFGPLRSLHRIEAGEHAEVGRLGPARQAIRHPFKLAGRQQDMAAFGRSLDAVLSAQQSQHMLVQGMAGMGKSRLLAEMMDTARQRFMSAVLIEIPDAGGDPYREAIVKLLTSLLDLHEATPFWDQLVARRLQPFHLPAEQMLLCQDLLSMRLTGPERQTLQAMGHAARERGTAQLLSLIVHRMARQRPMLMLIDDVHGASSKLVGTLASIIAGSSSSQIMWVLSARVEEPQRVAELQRLLPDVPLAALNLAPLKPHEARELARQFDHVDESWRAQCMQRAQGHPLYLMQLLMAEQGAQLPGGMQHLLQVRLDELTAQDRHVLRLTAVLGQAFKLDEIEAMTGRACGPLDALVQHCLLRQLGNGRYDFLHALIRQGVYEALTPCQREAMHARVARLFEGRDHTLHARHLHLARHADAPMALLAAARARQDVFDHEAALSLLNSHAEIDYAPRDVHAHAMAMGQVLSKMGQMTQARQAYESACQHAPDGVSNLSAKVALASVLNGLEDLAAEEALIDEALLQAKADAALSQLATLHGLKGHLYFLRGEAARSRMHHSKALDLASFLGDARLQAQALSGLGDSHYAEGQMVTASEHYASCLALCEAHGLRDIKAANRGMLASSQIYLCETASALLHAEAGFELARQVGHRRAEIVSRLAASWVYLGEGKAHEALSHIDEGLALSRGMGATRFEPWLQEAQARALLALGDEASAQRSIEASLEGVERLKLHAFIGPWVMGTWALLHHTDAQAMRMLQRAQDQISQGCVAHNVAHFHACAMEIHTLAGRYEVAAQIGQAWLQQTRHNPTPWTQGLHDFMAACANPRTPPTPDHPAWVALRERHILHVLLRLPRALLTLPAPACDMLPAQVT